MNQAIKDLIESARSYEKREGIQAEPTMGLLADEVERLDKIINTPEFHDFIKAVPLEASHQLNRWGTKSDEGKSPADWFWLIGYLAQKAMMAQLATDWIKAKHHCISTAAALANWYASIAGSSNMRPGIKPPEILGIKR